MPTPVSTGWCLAVTVSFVGYGLLVLRLLRKSQEDWLTAATAGMGVLTFCLGMMNLLRWIRSPQLLSLVLIGDISFVLLRKSSPRGNAQSGGVSTHPTAARLIACAALALVGSIALTGIHSHIVNYFDDTQAYFAYPLEALQKGSLQPQPFSERRINTSLGANYLLDAVLAVDGDVRSIGFLDRTLGYILYAAAIWILGRKLDFPLGFKGLLLGLLLILPVVQVNVAPIYLQSAVALSLLFAMHNSVKIEHADWRSGLLWGLIASVLCLTKSNGIVFVFALVAIFTVAHSVKIHNLSQIQNAVVAGLTVLFLALPWMIQQHKNEGTYLSPILGRGFHASHWGVVPLPRRTATLPVIAMVLLPDACALLVAAFLAWKLRSRNRTVDLSLVTFILAALAATPIIAFSTAGEAVDRFTFPFHVPALIIFGALMLASPLSDSRRKRWRRTAQLFLLLWIVAIIAILGKHHASYSRSLHHLEDTFAGRVRDPLFDELILDDKTIAAEEQRARTAQATVPVGAPILEATLFAYPYDFRRNKVYIADFPGMAGWAPGIPVGRGPMPVRDYLLSHNLQYFIWDRRLSYNNEDIGDFLRSPVLDGSLQDLIHHKIHHEIFPWSRMEWMVSRDVRHNLFLLAETNERLYDDGTLVMVELGARQ